MGEHIREGKSTAASGCDHRFLMRIRPILTCYDGPMTTISVSIADDVFERLSRVAENRSARPEDLLLLYAEYLARGGAPLLEDDVPVEGIMRMAEAGGSFDWLKDEPDLYSDARLEPFG
jgi:hypothetical protein